MEQQLPLLANQKSRLSDCPNCGGPIANGFAYLSGGAMLLSENLEDSLPAERLLGFLHVGIHGKEPNMRDSCDQLIVDDVRGGQFDLHWCSVACMRAWLMRLLDALQAHE